MLSNEKIEQIRKEAEDRYYYEDKTPHRLIDDISESCYIAGATAEAEKAQCLIEALDEINGMTEDMRIANIIKEAIIQYEK